MGASLIAGNPDLSAAQICARLSTMPTDDESERMNAKAREQAAGTL